jgi:hypothetical protein
VGTRKGREEVFSFPRRAWEREIDFSRWEREKREKFINKERIKLGPTFLGIDTMMKQYHAFIIWLVLISLWSTGNAYHSTFLPSMPMPTQYSNLQHYQQALQAWENVSKKVAACSRDIQLPPMPLPTQYNNLAFYQRAFQVWESVANSQKVGQDCVAGGSAVRVAPMPMPTEYNNLSWYRKALEAWEKVYTQAVSCRTSVQLPPMPMPTQYNNLLFYERALEAWEKAGSCQASR